MSLSRRRGAVWVPRLSSICGSIEAEPSHPGCHDGCVIEWHGWATIFTAPDAVDDTLLPATVDSVKRLVAARAGRSNEVVELNRASYLMHLWLADGHNHGADVVDDERSVGDRNKWQGYVMRRGEVTEHADPFLSPHVGLVEDGC